MHARNPVTGNKFGYCASLGIYPGEDEHDNELSNLAKEIQIGPSMFLMTVKQLMWLFFFISVLNIPLYYFYFQINEAGDTRNLSYNSIIDQFQRFSIANTEKEQACQTVNLASKSTFSLSCPGRTAQIDVLNFIGVPLNADSACTSMSP